MFFYILFITYHTYAVVAIIIQPSFMKNSSFFLLLIFNLKKITLKITI